MPEHYFSADPAVPFERESFTADLWGHELRLDTGSGVFSRGHLDHRQHVGDRVHARAAVLVGHFDAHQAVLAEHLHVLDGEVTGPVVMLGAGCDPFLGDPSRDVLDHQLLFAETELHGVQLLLENDPAIVTFQPGKTPEKPVPQCSMNRPETARQAPRSASCKRCMTAPARVTVA